MGTDRQERVQSRHRDGLGFDLNVLLGADRLDQARIDALDDGHQFERNCEVLVVSKTENDHLLFAASRPAF